MLTNINKFERSVRSVTGVLISILYLTGSITGGPAHFLAVIGVILITTAIINYCPLYLAGNISSNENSRA